MPFTALSRAPSEPGILRVTLHVREKTGNCDLVEAVGSRKLRLSCGPIV
jgi:hypothetical protein